MTTKLVIRVMDAADTLLAWTEIQGEIRGDGCLRYAHPAMAWVECAGTPTQLSVHWADVNVEVRSAFAYKPVTMGDLIPLRWDDQPVLVVGPMPGPLPPVTVRAPIAIAVPVGVMGARGRA
jgi:hypothetical protein